MWMSSGALSRQLNITRGSKFLSTKGLIPAVLNSLYQVSKQYEHPSHIPAIPYQATVTKQQLFTASNKQETRRLVHACLSRKLAPVKEVWLIRDRKLTAFGCLSSNILLSLKPLGFAKTKRKQATIREKEESTSWKAEVQLASLGEEQWRTFTLVSPPPCASTHSWCPSLQDLLPGCSHSPWGEPATGKSELCNSRRRKSQELQRTYLVVCKKKKRKPPKGDSRALRRYQDSNHDRQTL